MTPTLPALTGICTVLLLVGGSVAPSGGSEAGVAPSRRLGPFSLGPAIATPLVDPLFEPSPASVRDATKRATAPGSLHAALVDRIHGATPALLSYVTAPTAGALPALIDSVDAIGGTLPPATLIACGDEAALTACQSAVDAAGSAAACVPRLGAPAHPGWAAVDLIAEAVSGGFAVIFSDAQRPLLADPRAALEPLKERALADAAAGTAPDGAGWDASVVAARNTPATRALLAAWLARADGGREPGGELGAAASAARAVHPRLALRALPAAAWAAPCGAAEATIVRRVGACGGA